jgi:archaellum component FlaC
MTSTPEIVLRVTRLENDREATYDLISALSRTQDKHTEQLAQIESKLTDHDARFDGIDTRLDGIDTRLDGIDTQLGGINTQLGELKSTLQTVVELVTPRQP